MAAADGKLSFAQRLSIFETSTRATRLGRTPPPVARKPPRSSDSLCYGGNSPRVIPPERPTTTCGSGLDAEATSCSLTQSCVDSNRSLQEVHSNVVSPVHKLLHTEKDSPSHCVDETSSALQMDSPLPSQSEQMPTPPSDQNVNRKTLCLGEPGTFLDKDSSETCMNSDCCKDMDKVTTSETLGNQSEEVSVKADHVPEVASACSELDNEASESEVHVFTVDTPIEDNVEQRAGRDSCMKERTPSIRDSEAIRNVSSTFDFLCEYRDSPRNTVTDSSRESPGPSSTRTISAINKDFVFLEEGTDSNAETENVNKGNNSVSNCVRGSVESDNITPETSALPQVPEPQPAGSNKKDEQTEAEETTPRQTIEADTEDVVLRPKLQRTEPVDEDSDCEEGRVDATSSRSSTWLFRGPEMTTFAIDIDTPSETGVASVSSSLEVNSVADAAKALVQELSQDQPLQEVRRKVSEESDCWTPLPSSPGSLSSGDSLSSVGSRQVPMSKMRSVGRRPSDVRSVFQCISMKPIQNERKIVLRRQSDSERFGFHVMGDKPCSVSSVDPDTIAAREHMQEGDVITLVNGIDVQGCTQQEVVEIMRKDPSCMELCVARLSSTLSRAVDEVVLSGPLTKVLGRPGRPQRRERYWCTLFSGGVLYYYRKQKDWQPLGAVQLSCYTVTRAPEVHRTLAFRLSRYSSSTHVFIADDAESFARWGGALRDAAQSNKDQDLWLPDSSQKVDLPALSIRNTDERGVLYKQSERWRSWSRRYCVLKDACLYMYRDMCSERANRVVHFHGYTVNDTSLSSRKWTFVLKPPSHEMRLYSFYTDTEAEKDRWVASLRLSISRWVKVDDDDVFS